MAWSNDYAVERYTIMTSPYYTHPGWVKQKASTKEVPMDKNEICAILNRWLSIRQISPCVSKAIADLAAEFGINYQFVTLVLKANGCL